MDTKKVSVRCDNMFQISSGATATYGLGYARRVIKRTRRLLQKHQHPKDVTFHGGWNESREEQADYLLEPGRAFYRNT